MKRFFKLCVVATLLLLGVSSCMKEDHSFNFSPTPAYLLQTDEGKFIPQMRLISFDVKSASLTVEGKKINFNDVIPSYLFELPSSSYFGGVMDFDTITSAAIQLDLIGIDGKIEAHQYSFSPTTKKIGNIGVEVLECNLSEKEIDITLSDTVTNAKFYYLMWKERIETEISNDYTMWIPFSPLKIKGETLSETILYTGLADGTYRFAVGVGCGSIIKIDEMTSIDVTIKE